MFNGIRSSPSRDTGSTLLSLSILANAMVGTVIRTLILVGVHSVKAVNHMVVKKLEF